MDGPIFNALTKIFNVMLLSIIWVIGCLPVVTIGTSTAALYYTTVKVIRKDNGYLLREFWRSYRENLKSGIPVTIIVLLLTILMCYNRFFMQHWEGTFGTIMEVVYTAVLIIIVAVVMYLFPVLSRFKMKLYDLFKLTFYMAMKHLPTTLGLMVMFVLADFALYYMPVLVVAVPGTVCLIDSFLLERVLHQYMEKPEEGSDEAEKWYNR